MKLLESFRSAADKYGENMARKMLNAGIPDKYVLAACRFHCESPRKTTDILQTKFRQWMTYVVPASHVDVNNMTYDEFDRLIFQEMRKCVCPNPIYDDGKVTIGVFLSKKDAVKCPVVPIGHDGEFCVCGALGYNAYVKNGHKIVIIQDKSKKLEDLHRIVFGIVKGGVIGFWNWANYPMGDYPSEKKNEAWDYINSLPDGAQKALLDFAEKTRPSKS